MDQLIQNVSSVAQEVSAFDSLLDGFGITDGPSSRINEPRALLHFADKLLVEQAASLFVKRAILQTSVSLFQGQHASHIQL